MRRRPELFFVAVSAFCVFGNILSESSLSVASVKASADTEDFAVFGCTYGPPPTEEVIFVLILLFTPIFALALVIERWKTYYKIGRQIKTFKADAHAAARDFMTRTKSKKESGKPANCISEIVTQTLAESSTPCTNQPRPRIQIEQIRHRFAMLKSVELEQRIWVIAAIAITMPLFCIFGSAIKLTENFAFMCNELGVSPWGLLDDLRMMSNALAWALGTSIPAFWLHRRFLSRAKVLTAELDQSSAKLLDLVLNFQAAPWLLEPKSTIEVRNTQSLGRATTGLTLNRQA